ncbi:MAG TPA: thioredoxin domain-containing protein [Capsulimonadaceae bacterium]|nr:thioredoxin domain-containing protein [Capsulimonadaceae bacterium]
MVYINELISDAPATLTPAVSSRDHIRGPEDAPVTLLEYGDFECPHCRDAARIVGRLQTHFGDKLRFAFRHFPLLEIHPFAELAAEAAEAAGAQGKFWPMFNALFSHQRQLEAEDLAQYAGKIALDTSRFEADVAQHVYIERISEDIASGNASGVRGTPTYFINGVLYQGGYDLESLQAAIESVLAG